MFVTGRAAHHETLRVGDSRGHLGSRPAIQLKHPIHDWMEPKFMDLHPKHDRNSHAYIPPRFWAVSRDQILYFQSVVKKGVDEGMITCNSAHHDEGHTEADFKKERCGPSMYEVSEQCIMPGPCGRTRTGCVVIFSKSTRGVRASMSSSTNCFPGHSAKHQPRSPAPNTLQIHPFTKHYQF